MNAILYASNNDMLRPYLKDKSKTARKFRNLVKGVLGGFCPPEASDILENQIKWKRFLYGNNHYINMTPPTRKSKLKATPPY